MIPLNQSSHFRSKEKVRRQGLGSVVETCSSAMQRDASGHACYFFSLLRTLGLPMVTAEGQAGARFSSSVGGTPQIPLTQKIREQCWLREGQGSSEEFSWPDPLFVLWIPRSAIFLCGYQCGQDPASPESLPTGPSALSYLCSHQEGLSTFLLPSQCLVTTSASTKKTLCGCWGESMVSGASEVLSHSLLFLKQGFEAFGSV